jgi:competence protein ComEC
MKSEVVAKFLIVVLVLLQAKHLSPNHMPQFILWDVGQGQWATLSTSTYCLHLDAGGEKADWPSLRQECRGKRNFLHLSHEDWDHISWARKLFHRLGRACALQLPREPLNSKKKAFLKPLKTCTKSQTSIAPQWEVVEHMPVGRKLNSNDWSHVALVEKKILVPGDSSKRQEKLWLKHLKNNSSIRVLIAGHHGSLTSTSKELLQALPQLRQTLISSRKRVYGHPHPKVTQRLLDHGVATLTTELWGHIRMEMPPPRSPNSGDRK